MPQFDRVTVGLPGMIRRAWWFRPALPEPPRSLHAQGPGTGSTVAQLGRDGGAGRSSARRCVCSTTRRCRARRSSNGGAWRLSSRSAPVWGVRSTTTASSRRTWSCHTPRCAGPNLRRVDGQGAAQAIGPKKWSRRILATVDGLRPVFAWDRLYVGGGNAKKLTLSLADDVRIVPNLAGILGGVRVWDLDMAR